MTRSSGAASRAATARTADDLLAQRAAQFREKERELRRLVTDYHHAAAQARKIHEDAQVRIAKIAADAEARTVALRERTDKEASAFQDAADTAVRAIIHLGEPHATVASLTQLTAAQVRAIERTARSTTNRQRLAARQSDGQATPPAQTARQAATTAQLDTPQSSATQHGKPASEAGHEHPATIRHGRRPARTTLSSDHNTEEKRP